MNLAERDRFWGHATAFGAMWGAIEVTLGSFLHALKVPFGGTFLAATGAAFLVALRTVYPRRGVLLGAGVVCAGVKLLSPSTNVLGPMVGILVESTLVEIVCLLGANPVAAVVGGALAALWALTQKVLTQIVLYGRPVIALYRELLGRGEAWLGLRPTGGLRVVLLLVVVASLLGGAAGLFGQRVGSVVRARRRT